MCSLCNSNGLCQVVLKSCSLKELGMLEPGSGLWPDSLVPKDSCCFSEQWPKTWGKLRWLLERTLPQSYEQPGFSFMGGVIQWWTDVGDILTTSIQLLSSASARGLVRSRGESWCRWIISSIPGIYISASSQVRWTLWSPFYRWGNRGTYSEAASYDILTAFSLLIAHLFNLCVLHVTLWLFSHS